MKKGDILYSEWGYEQTNVDFYKVVNISKSGKTAIIVELESKKTYTGDMRGEIVPSDMVKEGAEKIRRKIKNYGWGDFIDLTSYESARLWNGKPKEFTSYA